MMDLRKFWVRRITVTAGLLLAVALSLSCANWLSVPETTRPAKADDRKVSNEPAAEATFLAMGDIMLSRGVAKAIDSKGDPLAPFNALASVFDAADFSFANFESPISGNDNVVGKGLVFNTRRRDIAGLKKYKFKIVSLANNHALDQGVKGLRFTREFMTEQGVEFAGVGENKEEAWQGKVITANGIRFGFISVSYASINDGGVATNPYVARIEETEYLKNSIADMKTKADIVVVSFHAGIEYKRNPHQPQIDFARRAIDYGADVAIGAHPHWIQTIEQYKGKYIFYSLGNFIFDQRQPGTTEGLMLRFTANRRAGGDPDGGRTFIDQIELMPVVIEGKSTPRIATKAEAIAILQKINISDPILRPSK